MLKGCKAIPENFKNFKSFAFEFVMKALIIINKTYHRFCLSQWEKSPKKQSVEVYFNNMALYFECRINKNARYFLIFWLIFIFKDWKALDLAKSS